MTATALSFPIQRERTIADPSTEVRTGAILIGVFLFGFAGWAAVARLDSAVHAPGVVSVSGERQAIQSLEGGLIAGIHVNEGDRVTAGEPLIDLATTDTLAQARSYGSRVFGLEAEIARIAAERLGAATVETPADFASLTGDDRVEAGKALSLQQAELNSQRALLATQRGVLRQRIAQVGNQIDGYRERQVANARQSDLNSQELDSTQRLFAKGYAPKTRVLALQREHAALDGEMGATTAEMARLRSSAGETRMQMLQLASERQQQNAQRFDAAQTELQTALPQWRAARDRLDQRRLRAPVSGTVIALVANTVGGVAAPGAKLMEIVPTRGALVINTRLDSSEAASIHVGQEARVKLGLMGGHALPPIDGVVTRVSADALIDERTGRSYYTASVAAPRAALDKASSEAGGGAGVQPGTPVDITIPLKRRTALEYWLDPLFVRLSPAMSEH